jgi:predicted enzyme related to lactoylglutathione lyase
MSNEPGSFCWFECGTRDLEQTKAFYSRVFGWNPVEVPMPGDGADSYTLLKVGDVDVAGMYELSGPQFDGVPAHWLSYVCVEDADAAARRAESLGGTILMAPFDVLGVGRMAFLSDPTEAHFAIFQPGEHEGVGEAGVLGWVELHTRDPESARDFYTDLFGWGVKEDPDGLYTEFLLGERPIAGMMANPQEQEQRVPDNWLPYALVDDCDAVVDLAPDLGATVVMPSQDVPNVGRFAVLADPGGAHLAVIKLDAEG